MYLYSKKAPTSQYNMLINDTPNPNPPSNNNRIGIPPVNLSSIKRKQPTVPPKNPTTISSPVRKTPANKTQPQALSQSQGNQTQSNTR